MNASEFVFGWELQGRGEPAAKDIVLGVIMFVLCFFLVLLGSLNIYIVRKVEAFHNAFGWFWIARTCAEITSNAVHVLYSAPVTIFQPKNIPLFLGFGALVVGGGGGTSSCILHQAVSANRFIAVYKPLQYKFIFSKANCLKIIAACVMPVPFGLILTFVIPCNMVGFSPAMYGYSFVSCEPNYYRNYSVVGSVLNKFCLTVCSFTLFFDAATLWKIVHIKLMNEVKTENKQLSRDIRFFMQASLQNVTMVITTVFIALSDQKYSMDDEVERILAFYMMLLAHLGNSFSLILFNPEVRRFLFTKKVSDSGSSTTTNASVPNVRCKRTTSHS
uniref:7TM_GPCR_Srx domain-containing protein n=1 Tax=Steinernema glaseri TaxID=37863 RepID=A0A1I8AUK3_9BILA